MRITDTFNLGHLKCTMMVHNGQHTLQVEDEYGAVSYKLKDLENEQILDIEGYLSLSKIKDEIIASFIAMRKGRDALLEMLEVIVESDDEII